ncbi:wax ester/triacylglycerol synthase family O-acyltransferase [Nocardioides sp.]|uniref:WS/DGAT/MGAT family O-acyltransferase n=1 Tax=Nocardioides sp. TaxID=35761 RepID=UPI0035285571
MATPLDPTALGFLLADSRRVPMHVGGLQLYKKPPDAGRSYTRDLFDQMREVDDIAPLFKKHPYRSVKTGGQYVWVEDDDFDIEYHVRHSALPKPGRVRELLELVSRLHSTRMATERPLWEWTLIEGLRDGRIAMYAKMHHALVDGVSANRLLQSILTTDPDARDLPPPWAARPRARTARAQEEAESSLEQVSVSIAAKALEISADAAGLPKALWTTLSRSLRNETSPLSLYAPKSILNQPITGSRRFAAQSWPMERLRGVARESGTTLNDVVLAMCSGALRTYLEEQAALPQQTLVAMVPIGLKAKQSGSASAEGGNAVGSVMVKLGTDLADPAARLQSVHESMRDGKRALAQMTPLQIQAMSAIGQVPAVLPSMLKLGGVGRPAYNLVISNVPGPRVPHFFNGAEMVGNYPLSIPIDGMALNITCTSYAGHMDFGLTGCRRTLPSLQRILTHLDHELTALEQAAGV